MSFTAADVRAVPLGLYIHWPWCVRKCPYCDFNSHALGRTDNESRYVDALLADLDASAGLDAGRSLRSVFIGGGTPNLMSPAAVERLLEGITKRFTLAGDCEITMEANPGAAEADRFGSFRALGVNRISLGVQSFSDERLARLGRIHKVADVLAAVDEVARYFDDFNLDMMFALPGQTPEDLDAELSRLVSMGSSHLSCYQLTIEEGTVFARRLPEGLPDDDMLADMADLVHERLTSAGFEHYEVSGYAKPGWRCVHNLNYWTFGDYLAAGAGAHGKHTTADGVFRTVRESSPARYMTLAEEGVVVETRRVETEDLPFEHMLNALRLTEGFDLADFEVRTGLPAASIRSRLESLSGKGLLVLDGGRVRLTPLGRAFLSDVQEAFLD